MGDLVMERRISHLRKAIDETQNPSPRVVLELMQALLESGDRRGALAVFRRFEAGGQPVTAELTALYNTALWSEPRALPTNLPKPRHPFVGRTAELTALAEALRSHNIAQVVAPGGMGKSRLALEIARRSVADFPDGVWWVDLSATGDVEALCARVARAMRLEDRAYDPQRLAERIGTAKALIVLDCCESCAPAVTAFATAIGERAPNAALLATSRIELELSAAAMLPLLPLSLPESGSRGAAAASDAMRFFLERAVDADSDFAMTDEHAVLAAEICRTVGALPLGIELACAYLAHADIREIHRRLVRNRLGDLSDALTETIRWTYDLLEPKDRSLLRALGIFDYPFTLDDAVAVAGADVRAGMERLSAASIVVSDRAEGLTWYRLLDTTRAFARAEMETHGETPQVRRRFVERMLAAALELDARIENRDGQAAKQLAAAHGNFMSAIELAASTATLAAQGLRIAGATAVHLGVVGYAAQTITHVQHVIDAARRFAHDRTTDFDHALESFAWLANRLSRAREAMRVNEERIARARVSRDICRIARALASSVIACINAGDYDRAREIATESVTASRECGEVSTRARALRSLASFYLNMDEPQNALPLYEEFFGLNEAEVPAMQYAMALHDYGLALKNTGDRHRARALVEKCVERALAIADYGTATHGYNTLGQIYLDDGDCAAAFQRLQRAVELSMNGINLRTQLDTFEDVVCAAIRADQMEQLAFVLGFVDAGREKIGFRISPEIAPRVELIRGIVRGRLKEHIFNEATMRGRLATMEELVAALQALRPGTEPPQKADRFSVLTRREREIAELAARGSTNRAIAEELSLSVRTVDVHVASIFRKLGIERRDQIAIGSGAN